MDAVGPPEIQKILAITDALGFHREAVVVPLWTDGAGKFRVIRGNRLEITAPAQGDFETWLKALPGTLQAMDLSAVRRST